jgi:hypothetical protein
MAGEHGGYRRPAKPAPASGPGALSRRTDGAPAKMPLPDAQYGEGADFQEVQSGASLGGAPPGSSLPAAPGPNPASVVSIGAPSAQPDTPVTDGAEFGAGSGVEALGLPENLDRMDAQDLRKYLPVLLKIAERSDTPPGTKYFVRRLLANL